MRVSIANRLMTADEYLHDPVSREPGELVRGVPYTLTPASGAHGYVVLRILTALSAFVEEHDLGEVFPDNVGFELSALPHTVRSPDAAFVRRDRLPAGGITTGWMKVVPDLIVEVLSPSETESRLEDKLSDYRTAGTSVMWVVNPEQRTVAVCLASGEETLLAEHEVLTGGPLLPGFSLPVAKLFAKLAR